MVNLGLVVPGAKAAAAVVAQLEAGGGTGLDGPEAIEDGVPEEVGGGPAVHPRRGVDPDFAGAVVNDREHRDPALLAGPGLGRVGRSQLVGRVGGDAPIMQTSRAASHARRRGEQAVLAHEPQHALATGADAAPPQPGADLLVALADER